jgi:hypothetical protein
MTKRIWLALAIALVAVAALASVASAASVPAQSDQHKTAATAIATQGAVAGLAVIERSSNPWVYITDTGKKYHCAGCRYLAHSKQKVRLKWAKSHGYKACKVCKPPK